MSRLTWTRRAALLAGAALLGAHFAAVIVWIGPLNPLSLKLSPYTESYVSPFFTQNWQLFAPDPISDERVLMARVRCGNGNETEFQDLTTKYIEAVQHDRFFPTRMPRISSNGMLVAQGQDPLAERLRASQDEDAPPIPLTEAEKEQQEQARVLLTGYAAREMSGECRELRGVSDVQLRFMVHEFPSWSKRHQWDDVGEISVSDLEWRKVSDNGPLQP